MSENKIPIYNPDLEDFSVEFTSDKGIKKTHTIRAMEYKEVEPHIAEHIAKHLANKLLHDRGIKNNPELDLKGIRKEIFAKL